MSVAEILDELPKLKAEERHLLFQRLNELEAAEIEESPEILAAIDEGIGSLEEHGGIPFEIVQVRLKSKWRSK